MNNQESGAPAGGDYQGLRMHPGTEHENLISQSGSEKKLPANQEPSSSAEDRCCTQSLPSHTSTTGSALERAVVWTYDPVREWNIKRSRDSRPLEVQVGDRYWLRVWDDGSEQAVSIGADHGDWVRGAVSVQVIELADDGSVVEETYARDLGSLKRYGWSKSAPPRGLGWAAHDRTGEKSTGWRRRRTWEVTR